MVLFDKAADGATKVARARALIELGDAFARSSKAAAAEGGVDWNKGGVLLQEAALAAQLETIRRKEDETFQAAEEKQQEESELGKEVEAEDV